MFLEFIDFSHLIKVNLHGEKQLSPRSGMSWPKEEGKFLVDMDLLIDVPRFDCLSIYVSWQRRPCGHCGCRGKRKVSMVR